MADPLPGEPLRLEHVKPRLPGHWGTAPSLIFLHCLRLDRIIPKRDLGVIFRAGPGHGAPGVVAITWLEGTSSETCPDVSATPSERDIILIE